MTDSGIGHAAVEQGDAAAPRQVPLLARFLGKLVLEVLPAALASVIGGFLFTQYQFSHPAASRQLAEDVAPATTQMMQLMRDEHAMMVDFLKAERATEKSRLAAAEKEDAGAAADARSAAQRQAAAALAAARAPAGRSRTPLIAAATTVATPPGATTPSAARAPLVIAGNEPDQGVPANQDSIVARTLALTGHVFGATLHVVSAIGGIPNWIAGRVGGA